MDVMLTMDYLAGWERQSSPAPSSSDACLAPLASPVLLALSGSTQPLPFSLGLCATCALGLRASSCICKHAPLLCMANCRPL